MLTTSVRLFGNKTSCPGCAGWTQACQCICVGGGPRCWHNIILCGISWACRPSPSGLEGTGHCGACSARKKKKRASGCCTADVVNVLVPSEP